MKKNTLYLAVLVALVMPGAVCAQVSDIHTEHTTPVEVNRELPRTRTVSYASEQAALDGGMEPSRYLQPLTEWTRGTDGDGNTVYSTKYKVPFEWVERNYFLRVGAATGSYTVIVNGELAGYNQSGRTAAEFDLSKVSVEGLNRLEIIVYANPASAVLSSKAAPEITGETYIVAQPRIRIRDYVAKANLEGENNTLELGVIVKSSLLNDKTVRVYYSLVNPDGSPGPYGHRDADFEMKREDTVRFFFNVPDARPWTHESPNVYTLLLKLQHEGRYTEYVAYKLGLRDIATRDGKVFVNGNEVALHVAEAAWNGEATEAELRRLKSEGINMIKVKGGPQPEAFYDLCDRIGLYVCNQADIDTRASGTSRQKGGNPSNDPAWEEAYVDRALTMYHTSKNHPSVVMFSLAENSANGYNLYESYLALKEAEPDRPIVYLEGGGEWNTDALYAALHSQYPHGLDERVKLGDTPDAGMYLPTVTYLREADVSVRDRLLSEAGPQEGGYGFFSLHNNYAATPLFAPVVEWTVREGNRVRSQGRTTLKDIAVGETGEFMVSYGKAKPGAGLMVEFTVYRPSEAHDPAQPTPRRNDKNALPGYTKLTTQTVPAHYR